MNIEEQIKQFLNEECEKYKEQIITYDFYPDKQLKKEYDMYFTEEKMKQIYNTISEENQKELINYAVDLSKQFVDQNFAHTFWYYFGYRLMFG